MNNNLKNIFSNFLDLYKDYIEDGVKKKHDFQDVSFMDIAEQEYTRSLELKIESSEKNNNTKEKRREIIKLAENIINCTNCELHKNVSKITGSGNVNSKIFIISLPPNPEEEKERKPLSGEIGIFFNKWLKSINIDYEKIFITNLVKCPPKKNKLTKNRINICREHLDKQISIINPKIIISLGQLTASSLRQEATDLNLFHGKEFYYNDILFVPTFHPSDVLSDPSLKKAVWEDLKKIKELMKEININE